MAENEQALTHEEMWDDSALIDSWNQALDEYKKYHSLRAKGASFVDQPAAGTHTRSHRDAGQETEKLGEPMGGREAEDLKQARRTDPSPDSTDVREPEAAGPGRGEAGGSSIGNASVVAPQVLLGTVQDEGLKKVLMSWYYAGYYTGLYEGQQRSRTHEHAEPQ